MTEPAPVRILIVDDSRCDAQLTQLWLKRCSCVGVIEVVRTGSEAIARIRREPPFDQLPLPDLILLDINLPDTMGWDLLETLRQDAASARIPVIILTGTLHPTDTERARALGAADCLCKPFDAEEYSSFVKQVETIVTTKCM